MTGNGQKYKLLYLMQILMEETDDQQGLSMTKILERLNDRGVGAERKSVYRDIEVLRNAGFDIQKFQRAPVEYAIAKRDFTLNELTLMIDAVQSSRFLSERKAQILVANIKHLASSRQRKLLEKRLHVEGRVRSQNESVLSSVDLLQQALTAKRKVEFSYCDYDVNKNRTPRKEGKNYCETPVQLVYSEGNYYLAAYNDKHEGISVYRVDRIASLRISDQPAARNEITANFDVTQYTSRSFSMFGGKAVQVKLCVAKEAMNAVIDRFGSEVRCVPLDENHARIYAMVMLSPTFYGWLAQFGTQVKIEGPQDLVVGYRDHLKSILENL